MADPTPTTDPASTPTGAITAPPAANQEELKRRYVKEATTRLHLDPQYALKRAEKLAAEGRLEGMNLPELPPDKPPAPAPQIAAPAERGAAPPIEPAAGPSPPRDLRVRELLEAARNSPDETLQGVIGRHARSLGMGTSSEYVKAGVGQDMDVLDYARRVREGEDPAELLSAAARRGVRAAEPESLRSLREQQRSIGREAIKMLTTDPATMARLPEDERKSRVRAIQMQMLPAYKLVTGPDEAEIEKALREAAEKEPERPGVIGLTGPELMKAAGFRESAEEISALGFREDAEQVEMREVARGGQAAVQIARDIIQQKMATSPMLTRMHEFDDRRFGSLAFIHGRRDELAQEEGLTAASAKAEGKDYELELKKLSIKAMRELAMARTAGIWTGPLFLPRNLHVDGDEPLYQQLHTAFTPNLEVLGLSAKGDVVFRQESPWEYVFGMLDLPLEAVVGVTAAATRGELAGKPFTPTLARSVLSAGLRGVAEREAFSTFLMESPAAQVGTPSALALAAVGLGVDILFPLDIPVAVAHAGARLKVGARAEKLVTTFARRGAADLLETTRDRSLEAVAARRRGQIDEANRLFDEGATAEARIRSEYKEADLGGSLDRNDAEVATRMGAGMGFVRGSGMLPGDLGYSYVGSHMAERRRVMEARYGTRLPTTIAMPGFEEFNPARSLRALDEATDVVKPMAATAAERRIQRVRAATAGVVDPDLARRAAEAAERGAARESRAEFVAAFERPSREVHSALSRFRAAVQRALGPAADTDADARKLLDELLPDAKPAEPLGEPSDTLRALWKDPDAWVEAWKKRRGEPAAWTKLFDEAGEPATTAEAQGRTRQRYDFIKGLLKVADAAKRASDPEQVLPAIERAVENVLASSESRARAAHIMAGRVRRGETKGDPEELRRMATEERARQDAAKAAKAAGKTPASEAPPSAALSVPGTAFARAWETAFKVSRDQAEAVARIADARAEASVAQGVDDSVEAWWKAQGLEVRRAAEGEAVDPAALLAKKPKSVKGRAPEEPGEPLFQRTAADLDVPEVWYSALRRAVEAKLPARASPDQILNTIRKTPGVKAEELEWTELGRWLEEKKAAGVASVEKEEVLRFLDEHAVKVEETVKGGGVSPKVAEAQDALASVWPRAQARYDRFREANKSAVEATEAKISQATDAEFELQLKSESIWADVRRVVVRNDNLGFDSPGEAAAAIRQHPDWRDRWPDTDITAAEEAAIQQHGRVRTDWLRLRTELSALRASNPYQTAKEAERVVSPEGLHWVQGGNGADLQDATRRVLFAEDEKQVMSAIRIIRSEAESVRARWQRYTLPGATSNYRELLLRLPVEDRGAALLGQRLADDVLDPGTDELLARAGTTLDTGTLERMKKAGATRFATKESGDVNIYGPIYNSAHWDEPNILAHVRMTDRVTADGKRVLHVEEVQSDWHQAGRASGYGEQPRPEGWMVPFIPDAPFKKSWPDLALKRVLRMAADEGYDGVTWNTGGQIQRIVGGEAAGQAHFYDTMLPSSVKHLAKEAPTTAKLSDVPDAVHYLPLTPEVKARAAAPQALFQAEGEAKASILFTEGRTIVTAFEKGDASSMVHEMWHVFRRDLERAATKLGVDSEAAKDLKLLEDWAGVKAGVWDTAAEEKVGRAGERYVYDGKAPIPGLQRVFEKLAQFMRRIYAKLRGSPLAGKMTPEVRGVFDRMLGAPAGATPGVPGAPRGPPKPPVVPPAAPPPRSPEEALAQAERAIRAAPLPVVSKAHAVGEQTFTESLRNVLEGPGVIRAALRMVGVGATFGGDAWKPLREMRVPIRDAVMAGTRTAEHGINDAIALVRDGGAKGNWETVAKFLDGEEVTFRSGRQVPSAGWSSSGAVSSHIRQAWAQMSDRDRATVIAALRTENRTALTKGQRAPMDKLVAELLRGRIPAEERLPTSAFLRDLSAALEGPPKALPDTPETATPNEVELVLGLLRWAGIRIEPGMPADLIAPIARAKLPEDLPVPRSAELLDLVGGIYGERDKGRAAVLLAAHGHGHRARLLWTGLLPGLQGDTLAISKGAGEAFSSWAIGKKIPDHRIPQVQALVAKFGINPRFVTDPVLKGKIALPSVALEQLAEAISRGVERFDPRFSWDEARAAGFLPAVLRYIKLRMTRGAIFIRPRYYLMNTFDHFNQLAMQPGVGVGNALASTLRILPQTLFTVAPGFARSFYASQRVTEALVRLGAGRPATAAGRFVLDPGNVERIRSELQRAGDKAAQVVRRILGGGKLHIAVNDVLDGGAAARAAGRADSILIGEGKLQRGYTFMELRDIARQEGAFASYDVSQLSNVIRGTILTEAERLQRTLPRKAWDIAHDALQDFMEFTTEMGEAWGERERLGAMVTLMEAGMTPRDAARLAVRGLYDYSGSMTKWDRNLLVSLTLPFWAYHKNANAQTINSMLSPRGAWVSGVIRRAHQRGPEFLSDAIYASIADPYGVDVDAMTLEGQASYWTLRHIVENGMGQPEEWPAGVRQELELRYGPQDQWSDEVRGFVIHGYGGVDNVPPDMRAVLHAIFAGDTAGRSIRRGGLYMLGEWLQKLPTLQTGPGNLPPPDPESRRRYYRGAGGITVPVPPSISPWVRWFYQDVGPDYPYTELFLPEPTHVSGMRHVAGVLATTALLGQYAIGATGAFDPADPRTGIEAESGMEPVPLRNALYEFIDPVRAPLLRDVAMIAGVEGAPRGLHPTVAGVVTSVMPYALRKRPATQDPQAPPEARETRRELDYLPVGLASMAFEVTPGLAEFNQILFTLDHAPLEERAELVGKLLVLARVMGLQTAETQRTRTFTAERPRFKRSVTEPSAREVQPQ